MSRIALLNGDGDLIAEFDDQPGWWCVQWVIPRPDGPVRFVAEFAGEVDGVAGYRMLSGVSVSPGTAIGRLSPTGLTLVDFPAPEVIEVAKTHAPRPSVWSGVPDDCCVFSCIPVDRGGAEVAPGVWVAGTTVRARRLGGREVDYIDTIREFEPSDMGRPMVGMGAEGALPTLRFVDDVVAERGVAAWPLA